ncbi:hypothetical protein [Stutzerimonas nitrititolerans]|uniref:hypothetical protein n=1 Tax=Stutzerimonas nitrititolerans TaxID=2482751 RepID=UPI0028A956B9|nr:hypothetical protein [Stutzerimonas nitrititolerans]
MNELAIYGLLVATVAYAIYPLGFEFYTYSSRELIALDNSVRGEFIKTQMVLHFLLYLVFLPLFCLLFYFEVLSYDYIGFFFVILILEHINQELFRMLVALSKQLHASLALFFRQGAWALVVVLVMYFYPNTRHLENILMAWALGGLVSLFISLYAVIILKSGSWESKVNWRWIKNGLYIAIPFLVATLGTNGIMTLDKYFIDFMHGKEALGVYVFYLALSISLLSFLDAGVFSFLYPKMVAVASKNDWAGLVDLMNKMFIQVVILSVLFLFFATLFLEYLVQWVGKGDFAERTHIFYILLAMVFLQALSYIPHYALYALRKDRPIIYSGLFSLLFFIAFVLLYDYFGFELPVPLSLISTFFIVLLWKTFSFLVEYKKSNYIGEEPLC